MTLIFQKNGKPDKTLLEYDQDVVSLGLKKAEAEKEFEMARAALVEAGKMRDGVEEEIKAKRAELVDLDCEYDLLKKEIQDALLRGSEELSGLRDREKGMESSFQKNAFEFEKTSAHLLALSGEVNARDVKLAELQGSCRSSGEELLRVRASVGVARRELESLQGDIRDLYGLKKEVADSLSVMRREFEDLQEIVSVLKSQNKDGLDLVASFEGERVRLREKEESLIRKEADLALYENRVKKMRQESGNSTDMTFS